MSNKVYNSKISNTVKYTMPEFLSTDAPDFVRFVERYYEWAELHNNFIYESKSIQNNYDYDTIDDDKLFVYKETLLRLFPNMTPEQTRHMLKFAQVFYANRGNIDSFKFLFRILWGEDVKITLPSDYIMRSSDGVWEQVTTLRVKYNDGLSDIIGRTVYGVVSGASAVVNTVSLMATEKNNYAELSIINVRGNFSVDEIIETRDSLRRVSTVTVASLGNYEIHYGGKGYKVGIEIPLKASGDGKHFAAKIGAVGEFGDILSLEVSNPGIEYNYEMPDLDLEDASLKDGKQPEFKPARIELLNTSVFSSSGKYKELKSALSDLWKLQDGYYYQEFSYVVSSSLKSSTVLKPLMNLVHPAGTKMFFNHDYQTGSFSLENKIMFSNTRFEFNKQQYLLANNVLKENGQVNTNSKEAAVLISTVENHTHSDQKIISVQDSINKLNGEIINMVNYSENELINLGRNDNNMYAYEQNMPFSERIYFSYEKQFTSIIDK